MTRRKSLRWIFDAVMRARGWSKEDADRAWAAVVAKRDDVDDQLWMEAWWDAYYRAEWASIRAGWRPRTPATADQVQRWFDADRRVQRS